MEPRSAKDHISELGYAARDQDWTDRRWHGTSCADDAVHTAYGGAIRNCCAEWVAILHAERSSRSCACGEERSAGSNGFEERDGSVYDEEGARYTADQGVA